MKKVRLGDICTVVSGTTPKSHVDEYWNGDKVWITPAEINEDTLVVTDSVRHISESAVKDSSLKSFPKGTVILSSRAPIGKMAIAGCEMYCNQGFKNLICSEKINNLYLLYFLRSRKNYLNSLGRGATFKEISKGIVENIKVPLPSMDTQIQIGNRIRTIEKLIGLRKKQLFLLDDLIKSRFVEMFGDGNYSICNLYQVSNIVSGITKGRKTKDNNLLEVPYMAVSNVKRGFIDWSTIKTILATKAEVEQYRLKSNDVLITEGGDPDKVGRGAVIINPPKNCIHQNHIFRVRLNCNLLTPEYFEEYLQCKSARKYFLKAAKQTTGIASINMKQLRELPVALPPIGEQIRFSIFTHHIDKSKLSKENRRKMIQNVIKYREK